MKYRRSAAILSIGFAGAGLAGCSSNGEVGTASATFSYGPASPGTIEIPTDGATTPGTPSQAPETQSPTSASPTHTTEATTSSPSTYPEIAQFSTDLFTNTNLATAVGETAVGKTYMVICWIPYNDHMGSTLGGGEYVIEDPDAQLGYAVAAANDFENGPMPNQNASDPALKNDQCAVGEY